MPILLFLLIAFTPALCAIVTWDTVGDVTTLQAAFRLGLIPVALVEMAAIGCALLVGTRPWQLLREAPTWVLAALLVVSAVALFTAFFVAPDPIMAQIRTYMWFLHLLFGLSIASLVTARPQHDDIAWWMMGGGVAVYGLLAVIFALSIPNPMAFDWGVFGLGVGNIRHAGYVFALGGSIAFALAGLKTGRTGTSFALFCITLLVGLSFWSGSRGAVIAIAGAACGGWFLFPQIRSARTAAIWMAGTIAGVAASLVHVPPSPAYGLLRIAESAGSSSLQAMGSGRVELWNGALRLWAKHPLIGVGEGQFRLLVPEAQGLYVHPHNSLLQFLVQWGLLGAVCFFAVAGHLLLKSYRVCRKGDVQNAAPAMAVIGMLTLSMYDGTLYYPYPLMMVAFSLAYMLAKPAKACGVRAARSSFATS